MNAYVVLRLSSLVGVQKKLWVYLALAVLTFSFLIAAILESKIGNAFTRVLYILSSTWMGVLLLLFFTLLFFELLRLAVPISPRLTGTIVVAIVSILTIYALFNARRVSVRYEEIPSDIDMTIVHLSDIHLGSVGSSMLRKIVDRTNNLEPDIVVITGDLFDNHRPKTREAAMMLKELSAPTFMVTGNHEGYVGIENVVSALKDTNVRFLRNEAVDIRGIQIVGIDDSYNKNHLAEQLPKIELDSTKFTVLLYHRPTGVEAAEKHGVDLMLTGHLHNGQIVPFNLIVRCFFKHVRGLFKSGEMYLNVSTGSGTWGPPMRLGSRCEIVAIRLWKKN